jgi:hypothetical protein
MQGLPDGTFSNPTSQFGLILECLAMEDVDIFYGHLVNFPAIWYVYSLDFLNICPLKVYIFVKNLQRHE